MCLALRVCMHVRRERKWTEAFWTLIKEADHAHANAASEGLDAEAVVALLPGLASKIESLRAPQVKGSPPDVKRLVEEEDQKVSLPAIQMHSTMPVHCSLQ